jgi:phage protein D
MLTPAYKLTMGKTTIDSAKQAGASTVVDLIVSVNMETAADSLTVVLGQVGGQLKPALGDKATVALGYADGNGPTQVIAGTVVSIAPNLNTSRVVAYTSGETLLRSYFDQTYESKTAGAIVQDLAKRAKVTVANADDGIDFPAYVIDGRRCFSRHISDLAALCGFDSYFSSDGELVFEKFSTPKAAHTFEHTQDILELQVMGAPRSEGTVQAWGESPTSSKGPDSAAWLTKNFGPNKGTAGSGKPVFLLERPELRTGDAAKAAAAAAETRVQRDRLRGRLLSVGRPEVKLGDSIQLRSMPDATLNKSFQVRSVTHRITKDRGFTTEIGFRTI